MTKPRLYKGVWIRPAPFNYSGIKWEAYVGERRISADNLTDLKIWITKLLKGFEI